MITVNPLENINLWIKFRGSCQNLSINNLKLSPCCCVGKLLLIFKILSTNFIWFSVMVKTQDLAYTPGVSFHLRLCVSVDTSFILISHIIFCKYLKNVLLRVYYFSVHWWLLSSLCPFLTVVKQKAALEKEAKLSILEAGVADVSTVFLFIVFKSMFQVMIWVCISNIY